MIFSSRFRNLGTADQILTYACFISYFISLTVIVGWCFDISLFKSILPQFIAMKANTALCIGTLGLGIYVNRHDNFLSHLNSFLKLIPSIIVFWVALATLYEYQYGVNLGIDELFFKDQIPAGIFGSYPPGRMAPITATLFLLISLAQILMFNTLKPFYRSGQALLFISFITAFQAMVSYLWGMTFTFGVAYYTQMALHTTVGIVVLSIGMFASRPHVGWVSILSSDTVGGVMSRKLILWAIIVPPMIQWLNLLGQNAGYYNADFGAILKVTGNIIFFVSVVLTTAFALHQTDLKKREEEKKARELLVEKESAEAIRVSENRLRAIYEATFEAILGMDNEGRTTDWNKQAERIFGWTREEVLGRKISELIIPEKYREAHEKGMVHFLLTGEGPVINKTIEIEALRKNQEVFPIQLSVKPIKIHNSYVFMAFISDITERKKSETELVTAKQNALNAATAKTVFLANMSHEIRTPLNGIIGMTDLLLETKLDQEQIKYAKILQNTGTGLLTIINDILDFSKIDAGKMKLEVIEFNPVTLIEDQTEILAVRAWQKNISLMTFVDPYLPTKVKGDPGRIGQILLNLISNAIKFTEQGTIYIKLTYELMEGDRRNFIFNVTDTGIGMSPDKINKIFQPFGQADESTARRFGGTGLGLSISRQLVDLMGGKISVKSEVGIGSTFSFEIPLEIIPSAQTSRIPFSKKLNVLLIDNDPLAAMILKLYLDSWDMSLVISHNSVEAYQLLQSTENLPIDLIIIDQQIAETFKNATKIPTIMITTFDKRSHASKIAQEGNYNGLLTKPFKQSELYDLIMNVTNVESDLVTIKKEVVPATDNYSHYKILVAEDNQVNQLLTMTQLKKIGYSAQAVANGKEVIETLRTSHFDLILMDCQMPEMDGYEATRIIRHQEELTGKHIPILALTANVLMDDQGKCREAGMDGFISKPTKRDTLHEAILKHLMK